MQCDGAPVGEWTEEGLGTSRDCLAPEKPWDSPEALPLLVGGKDHEI